MPLGKFGEDVVVESGTVVMWAGLLSDMPAGWAICDGNNGTPDLTGRFVRSVSDAATNPGATGGTSSHTLSENDLPVHSHTGGTDSGGNHSHPYDYSTINNNERDQDWRDSTEHGGYPRALTSYNAPHSHTASLNAEGASSPSAVTNEPENYEIAFIMKL